MSPVTADNLISWDTETWLIAPGYPAPRLVCAAVADCAGARLLARDDARATFRALLEGECHLVGTNFVYDLSVHAREDPDLLPLIFAALEAGRLHSIDVLEALHDIGRGCLYEDRGRPIGRYSQEFLESRYLRIDRSEEKHGADAWRLRYAELDGLPIEAYPREAVDYPIADARGAREIALIQLGLRPWIEDGEIAPRINVHCEADEMRAAWARRLESVYGLRTDGPLVEATVAEFDRTHRASRERFLREGLVEVVRAGPSDTADEVPEALLREVGATKALRVLEKGGKIRYKAVTSAIQARVQAAYGEAAPLTETGRVSASRDTLEESGDPLLEAYGKAGVNEKLLSTYSDVLRQGVTTPINPSVRLAASGRCAYSNPNLQNLPRDGHVRECFVPRPGRLLCSVDYSGQELVTLAQVCFTIFGQSAMRDAINAGQDLHTRLAARIGGTTYEDMAARLKAGDASAKNLRTTAKPINFGLPGLMGVAKLVLTARKQDVRFCELAGELPKGGCGSKGRVARYRDRPCPPTCVVCLELAARYVRLWREEWPEMEAYLEIGPRLVDQCMPIQSLGNGMVRLEDSPGSYSNHLFQNLAAQCTKRALWRLTRECLADQDSVLYGRARPVVDIHDEILTEIAEEHVTECADRQAAIMISEMRVLTPDVAVSAVPAVARRWFKGMEPLRDRSGLLVPWWPHTKAGALDATKWSWPPDLEIARADLARVAF